MIVVKLAFYLKGLFCYFLNVLLKEIENIATPTNLNLQLSVKTHFLFYSMVLVIHSLAATVC